MIDAEAKMTELIDDAHSLGNKFIFMMGASGSEHRFSERARSGFIDISADLIEQFDEFELKLKSYRTGCAPSCSKSSRC
ncbi:hypothetical protein ACIPIN_19780 [Pseudomonas sp. NPDC087697]|uniref:hypothetical protein n=1 Tax=Pseudomonas sp. NPDC087697 TaxID=3364447 RepID=UPI00382C873D